MRLFYTPTSPFVRKVLVAAHELGVADRIETTYLRPDPTVADPDLSKVNPLSKIPVLVLDDGEVLYDSAVICEHLDTLGSKKLTPPAGRARLRVLRTQALCDGVLDAGILVFNERVRRPRELVWNAWERGQTQKVDQGVAALERELATDAEIDLAQICTGVTIGWLAFREVLHLDVARHPRLSAWYARFAERASMRATEPTA